MAVPTYPEICLHSLEDLDQLDSREKVCYKVDDSVREIYRREIIPFWKGKSLRERLFERMEPEWLEAYSAGVFTEFMEQRSPGHTVLGEKIYRRGFRELIDETRQRRAELGADESLQATPRRQELRAMEIAAEALVHYAERNARYLDELAIGEGDDRRRSELLQMAAVCRKVPAAAPESFREALQYYWFVHLGVITELNPWDAFSPGRLDQHLLPFYERDLERGELTRESARELLQAFWIKFNNQPAPPKVGVTAQESGTHTDFALINLGGVKEDGGDAVNVLSFLLLEVIEELRILQPSSMIQLSRRNTDPFLQHALEIVRTGFGQPSIFNADAIVQELLCQGKTLEDARRGGASGCVEAGAFGREAYFLTGYFNLPKLLELALHDGVDPLTGRRIGSRTGAAAELGTFEELLTAYATQLQHFADIKIRGNNTIEGLWAGELPAPFLSLLIDDCLARGRDYHDGGARYNTSYIQGVGLGSITDSLAALKYHVYDRETLGLAEFVEILRDDFANHEEFRTELVEATPKYGNDDDYADELARRVFELYHSAIDGRPNTRGGCHRINLLPTTCHIYFGSKIGALPDGRRVAEPLSEGISPVQGRDRCGPTAVICSTAKLDQVRTGGTLLNQKFTPQVLNSAGALRKLGQLVRTYFRMDGHHIQFNVVDAETLRRAQREPENHRDLIVRVAGYSDYFNELSRELQDEIIRRTEQDFG